MKIYCPDCQKVFVPAESSAGQPEANCPNCGKAVALPDHCPAPGCVIDDFLIEKALSKGGMGEVFLARQLSLDRPVALKVLQQKFLNDKEYVESLFREARAAGRISHPHIVQAYAVGEDEGVVYFAMEFIRGETLKVMLKREKKLEFGKAAEIIREIASALDAAWREEKLVHQDIKPDNIMLDANGFAKLADLGLAKTSRDKEEEIGDEVLGTPQYISPEQLLGIPTDVRSDIYSLGATFFHLVTGRFAYVGDNGDEIARQHVEGTLTPPKDLNPELPDALNAIILKMMAKEAKDRYQTPDVLVKALDVFLRNYKREKKDTTSVPKLRSLPKLLAKPPKKVVPAPPAPKMPVLTKGAGASDEKKQNSLPKLEEPSQNAAVQAETPEQVTPAAEPAATPVTPVTPAAEPAATPVTPTAEPAATPVSPAAEPAATPVTPVTPAEGNSKPAENAEPAESPKAASEAEEKKNADSTENSDPAGAPDAAPKKRCRTIVIVVVIAVAALLLLLAGGGTGAYFAGRKVPFLKPFTAWIDAGINDAVTWWQKRAAASSVPRAEVPPQPVKKPVPVIRTRPEFAAAAQKLIGARQHDVNFLRECDAFFARYSARQTKEEDVLYQRLRLIFAEADERLRVAPAREVLRAPAEQKLAGRRAVLAEQKRREAAQAEEKAERHADEEKQRRADAAEDQAYQEMTRQQTMKRKATILRDLASFNQKLLRLVTASALSGNRTELEKAFQEAQDYRVPAGYAFPGEEKIVAQFHTFLLQVMPSEQWLRSYVLDLAQIEHGSTFSMTHKQKLIRIIKVTPREIIAQNSEGKEFVPEFTLREKREFYQKLDKYVKNGHSAFYYPLLRYGLTPELVKTAPAGFWKNALKIYFQK